MGAEGEPLVQQYTLCWTGVNNKQYTFCWTGVYIIDSIIHNTHKLVVQQYTPTLVKSDDVFQCWHVEDERNAYHGDQDGHDVGLCLG